MPHHCVMNWRIMLGKIIRFVGYAWSPVNEEVSFQCSILDSIESLVHCFGFSDSGFGNTKAVELSVSIGVVSCFWPSSLIDVCIGIVFCILLKSAPSLAAADDDMT